MGSVKNYMSIYVICLCFMYVATVLCVSCSFVRKTSPVCLVRSRDGGVNARARGNGVCYQDGDESACLRSVCIVFAVK